MTHSEHIANRLVGIDGGDDGVIVIPREEAERWLTKAREKLALEQQWDKELSAGDSMLKVFGIQV